MAEDLQERIGTNPSALANVALIYVGLGNKDQAMIWLSKAYDARFNPSILLRPAFDSLRSDTRFSDLQRRIGMAQPDQTVDAHPDPSGDVAEAM
jgi:hypothetical protein